MLVITVGVVHNNGTNLEEHCRKKNNLFKCPGGISKKVQRLSQTKGRGNGEKVTNYEKAQIIKSMLDKYTLKVLLEVADLKRRTYYNNVDKEIVNEEDEHIKQCVIEINKKNKHYGSRRIRGELKRNYNIDISRLKVRKLMDELGIVAKILLNVNRIRLVKKY